MAKHTAIGISVHRRISEWNAIAGLVDMPNRWLKMNTIFTWNVAIKWIQLNRRNLSVFIRLLDFWQTPLNLVSNALCIWQ